MLHYLFSIVCNDHIHAFTFFWSFWCTNLNHRNLCRWYSLPSRYRCPLNWVELVEAQIYCHQHYTMDNKRHYIHEKVETSEKAVLSFIFCDDRFFFILVFCYVSLFKVFFVFFLQFFFTIKLRSFIHEMCLCCLTKRMKNSKKIELFSEYSWIGWNCLQATQNRENFNTFFFFSINFSTYTTINNQNK